MYGLAVNLIVSVSGHPWIVNEMSTRVLSVYEVNFQIACLDLK